MSCVTTTTTTTGQEVTVTQALGDKVVHTLGVSRCLFVQSGMDAD